MKKIIIILLAIFLSILSFGYLKVGGIYRFEEHESIKLFGKRQSCRWAGQIKINHIILEHRLKGTSEYDVSKEELYRQMGYVEDVVRIVEEWDQYENPYTNIQPFHSYNCPKIKHGSATSILGVENMRLLRDFGMVQ